MREVNGHKLLSPSLVVVFVYLVFL